MTILIDMDGPLVQWEQGIYDLFVARYPGAPAIHPSARRLFKIKDEYPEAQHGFLDRIMHERNFYRNLLPEPGGIEALRDMLAGGLDPVICTAPLALSSFCASEKMLWTRHYLGDAWVDRLVMARDKTRIHGNILIDDRPHVTGQSKPTWRQVTYDAPYNRDIGGPRLIGWTDWRKQLSP